MILVVGATGTLGSSFVDELYRQKRPTGCLVRKVVTDLSLLLGTRLKRKGWAPMLMRKYEKVCPILPEDLAWCIVDAIDNEKASYKIKQGSFARHLEDCLKEKRDLN